MTETRHEAIRRIVAEYIGDTQQTDEYVATAERVIDSYRYPVADRREVIIDMTWAFKPYGRAIEGSAIGNATVEWLEAHDPPVTVPHYPTERMVTAGSQEIAQTADVGDFRALAEGAYRAMVQQAVEDREATIYAAIEGRYGEEGDA